MHIERTPIIACILLCLFSPHPFAESSGAKTSVTEARPTQTLVWPAVEFAGGYRVEVDDQAGKKIADEYRESPSVALHLGPGSYRYRITVYNLLGKPESVGDWVPFSVLKAERPTISSVASAIPGANDPDSGFVVTGEGLSTATEFFLVDSSGAEVIALGHGTLKDASSIDIPAPGEKVPPGLYRLRARNPGGLVAESPSPVRVEKPKTASMDRDSPLLVGLGIGWAGYVPVGDDWYTGIWDDGFYPVGLSARADIAYRFAPSSSAGLRVSASYHRPDESISGITLTVDLRRFGCEAFFRQSVSPSLSFAAGVGGGIVLTWLDLVSSSAAHAEIAAISPDVAGFLEAQWTFGTHATLSANLYAVDTIMPSHHCVALVPGVVAGWSF
jgi:hypothetical protein